MLIKPCTYCAKTNHQSIACFQRPKKRIKPVSEKTLQRKQETDRLWFELNPPDEKGLRYCYLRISPNCPYKLTKAWVRLEHVKSKARYPELRFDVTNIKPACDPCNAVKGSLDLEDLVVTYPHLTVYL